MNKPGIFAGTTTAAILGAIAIWTASTASVPSAPSDEQINPSSMMMMHSYGLRDQRMTDLSVVFVDPVGP